MLSERQSRIAEEEARAMAKAAAEQAIRDAEAKRIADERAAALAIEEARVAVEREARMRVEAAEAAERARHQAQLDEARLAQEMEIAREMARRTRPKWMLVVTVGAVLLASALTWFAIDRMRAADDADRIAEQARAAADENKRAIKELDSQLVALNAKASENNTRLNKAIDDVLIAEGAAAIAESKRKVQEAQERQRELDRQRAAIKAAKDKIDRNAKFTIKQECLDGVIGKKGC